MNGDFILDSKLVILVNMFNIGFILFFFIMFYVVDIYGRRLVIVVGCLFMIGGGFLIVFVNGYGSVFGFIIDIFGVRKC